MADLPVTDSTEVFILNSDEAILMECLATMMRD